MRLSVQVVMDTLFRPREPLRQRIAKFVAATPTLWRQRRDHAPMLCMHCRTYVADKKNSHYTRDTYKLYVRAALKLLKRMVRRVVVVALGASPPRSTPCAPSLLSRR